MKALNLTLSLALLAAPAAAQESPQNSLGDAQARIQSELERSAAELTALREKIKLEKLPMAGRLNELELERRGIQEKYQEATRVLDLRAQDVNNLDTQIKARKAENNYVSTLLTDYVQELETRLHIAEKQLYVEPLDAARLAPENSNLTELEIFELQTALTRLSIERLEEVLGGARFEGQAIGADGLVKSGTFVLVGPVAVFAADGAQKVGTVEQLLDSVEPSQVDFTNPEDVTAALGLVRSGSGALPLDTTLGDAHKIEATENETFLEHVKKGGVVMIPIFAMAGAALLVALFKWIVLMLQREPSKKQLARLLDAVGREDYAGSQAAAAAMKGPIGRMLAVGVEHLKEPRELIEEVMYETVLTTRLKLQGLLPFIAICAASAPLLGLLGTVTGIIATFKLITVFGSGDVKSLSGGISEALITTKFGLIVAIPSLLLHAFLARKARRVIDHMEKAALAFVNAVSKTPTGRSHYMKKAEIPVLAPADPKVVREQVRETLSDMLDPIGRATRDQDLAEAQA